MNSKPISRSAAAGSVAAAIFVITACGNAAAPPGQVTGVDEPSPTAEASERHATEHSGWMRKGGSTGDHKSPMDSRP